jgi:hypothetical protein
MIKLNAALGLLQGVKSRVRDELSLAYRTVQKPDLFSGFQKSYLPLDEEGEKLPPENKIVQYTFDGLIAQLVPGLARLIDLQAAVDAGNQVASGQLRLSAELAFEEVPVSTLLWLEKQFTDLRTLVLSAPVVDPAKVWSRDENTGLLVTDARTTTRTRKVPRSIVLYDATDKHPAQVQAFQADEIVGSWTTTDQSGALTLVRQRQLLARIDGVLEALKLAREEANATEVPDQNVGRDLLDFVFRA